MPPNDPIDLDVAAASPLREEVRVVIMDAWKKYGNPSSPHALGRESRSALDDASDRLASLLGRDARELTFTGSATEAMNLGILGLLMPGQHVVVSALEHHAALAAVEEAVRRGSLQTVVAPDREGVVSAATVEAAITPATALVVLMVANNEVGSIEPIADVAALCREHSIPLLSDASAAVGALPLHEIAHDAALLAFSAAKCGGPKGVGVLVAPEQIHIRPIIHGGGQQHHRRSGTEDVAGILGLVRAIELAEAERAHEVTRLTRLRDLLFSRLRAHIPDIVLHGHPAHRLPGNLHIGIPGIEAEALVLRLDREGVFIASGAACTTPMVEPSHVLAALGLPPEMVRIGVRLTIGRATSEEDIERASERIVRVVRELRG